MRKTIDDLTVLDIILEVAMMHPIDKDDFCRQNLPDGDEAMSFLVAEGFMNEDERRFYVSYKGRVHFNKGGFVGEFRQEQNHSALHGIVGLVAAGAAVGGLVVQFVL